MECVNSAASFDAASMHAASQHIDIMLVHVYVQDVPKVQLDQIQPYLLPMDVRRLVACMKPLTQAASYGTLEPSLFCSSLNDAHIVWPAGKHIRTLAKPNQHAICRTSPQRATSGVQVIAALCLAKLVHAKPLSNLHCRWTPALG